MRTTTLVAASIATALSLSACGDDAPTEAVGPDPGEQELAEDEVDVADPIEEPAPEPSEIEIGEPATEVFGPACTSVPAQGAFPDTPVATAATEIPALSTLVDALTEAGLVETLDGAEELTVFAPTDSAFRALGPGALDEAMADPTGQLTELLTYHVVPMRLAPEELPGVYDTLAGGELEVSYDGEVYTVGGSAQVVCGGITTENATVYVIDEVLAPPAA